MISSEHNKSEALGMWVWFVPAAYIVHVAEEAFGGNGLMEWMTAGGGVRFSLAQFLGINLVFGLGGSELSGGSGIAWEAHVGGFVAGFLMFGFFDRRTPA